MEFSIIIPARNEEKWLPRGLEAVDAARQQLEAGTEVEIVVVLNRCTDSTETIARAAGARTVHCDARNLSIIRNTGAEAARGRILVTIDADSRMSPGMLKEIKRRIDRGKTIGGGVMIFPERWSLGILCAGMALAPLAVWYRISCGLFWCLREDFLALGGFDPEWISAEDIDFAQRLRAYGKKKKKRFHTLYRQHIVTSCRKFDTFGDWFWIRNFGRALRLLKGRSQQDADWFFYKIKR